MIIHTVLMIIQRSINTIKTFQINNAEKMRNFRHFREMHVKSSAQSSSALLATVTVLLDYIDLLSLI